jgi:polysaccharide export outer membrane protein
MKTSSLRIRRRVGTSSIAAVLVAALAACSALPQAATTAIGEGPARDGSFRTAEVQKSAPMMSKADLALIEESPNPVYRIGSGDVVRVDVFGRPEVSGKHVVGPDGLITVPFLGDVALQDLTREEARRNIANDLRPFYAQPRVTVAVEEYTSNQVTVLGRVERAGVIRFTHPPVLAEVLASAGALPILDKQATLTRCAIMRGRDKLIWVDLKALLNGDPDYNLRMKRGDIVFIPDSADTSVHVMGMVAKPGAYRLTPRMTVLDAISQAGGPTEDAKPSQIGLYRAGAAEIQVIDFAELIDPARRVNFGLQDGDVIFVPRNGLADFGYLMRQIAPGLSVLTIGATVKGLL